MYQDYDNAVSEVKKYLAENYFSNSVIYSHLHCYRSFRKYLEENHIPYCHEEAVKWLNSNKLSSKHSKYKMFRLSLFQLNDVTKNGCISNNRYVYEDSYNYERLPDWCKLLLYSYLNHISNSFSKGYVSQHRIACSKFLIYICSIGAKNTGDINHLNIIGYFNQSKHRTIQVKNMYNRSIRHFFQYLADKNMIPPSLKYELDPFVIPRIIIIEELPDEERKV